MGGSSDEDPYSLTGQFTVSQPQSWLILPPNWYSCYGAFSSKHLLLPLLLFVVVLLLYCLIIASLLFLLVDPMLFLIMLFQLYLLVVFMLLSLVVNLLTPL